MRRLTSRRRFMHTGLGVGAGMLLAACGGDNEPTATTAPDASASPAATEPLAATEASASTDEPTEESSPAASSGFPIELEHALGTTTFPAQPERIICTEDNEPLDTLQAIGIRPVLFGITRQYGVDQQPWRDEAFIDGVESFDFSTYELDLEQLAAKNPDLIIDVWTEPDIFEQESGIAPTLVLKVDDLVPWQDMQRLVGQATGAVEESEAAIAETERILDEQAARLTDLADKKVTVAYAFGDEFLVQGANTTGARILARMGLNIVSPNDDDLTSMSLERWNEISDADIILSLAFFPEDAEAQESSPLFQSLPAVVNGGYVTLDNVVGRAWYRESTLSVRWVAPMLADAVLEAAAGNGKKLS